MKSLQNRLFEGFFKNAGGMVRPSTKKELQEEEYVKIVKQYSILMIPQVLHKLNQFVITVEENFIKEVMTI